LGPPPSASRARPFVYLVERHVESQAELHGLATEYVQCSERCGIPAILATLRTADELVDAIA
jgi:hypothetical protein